MRLTVFFSIAMCAVSGYGQSTAIVSGTVVAEGNEQSLQGSITVMTSSTGVHLRTAEVDARGGFSITIPAGGAVIVARADGYASQQREIVAQPGTNPTLTFSLARAATVSGRVVDVSGAGVAGARVWVQYRGQARGWRLADEIGGEPTDALGQFTIPTVAQGRPFILQAESEDWLLSSSQTMMIRTPEVDGFLLLVSRRGATVSGRVMDPSGRPVPNAEVQLRAMPGANEFTSDQRDSIAFARRMNRSAISGSDGSYAFRGVPPGRIVVTGELQNQRGASEVEISSGTVNRIDLVLR
jgi:hypothetical protein